MRVLVEAKRQAYAPVMGVQDLILKLQSALDDEAKDTQKYRMLAFDAITYIQGPLGKLINKELSAISEQENTHRDLIGSAITAIQEWISTGGK
jgi:hypothetical protein